MMGDRLISLTVGWKGSCLLQSLVLRLKLQSRLQISQLPKELLISLVINVLLSFLGYMTQY